MNSHDCCVDVSPEECTSFQKRSLLGLCAEVFPFPCNLYPFCVQHRKEQVLRLTNFKAQNRNKESIWCSSAVCHFASFVFLFFQKVFWRKNWTVFRLAGIIHIFPHPIFCDWGDRVSLWMCNNRRRYSQVSDFSRKMLSCHLFGVLFQFKYISHASLQSLPLSFIHPEHTCNFPSGTNLGAVSGGNDFRIMLVWFTSLPSRNLS